LFFGVIISTVGGRGGFIFFVGIITIREGLGSFFLAAISTIGGGIYLCFLSRFNDDEEQQFFDKGWDFDVLELACLLYKQLVLVAIITIREGLGSYFFATVNTVGGGIYLCFLS